MPPHLPVEIIYLIIDSYLESALDSILHTFRFILSLRTTAHSTPTLHPTAALPIEYPCLDLLPLILTSRLVHNYLESHPSFFRIYVYNPICHFRDINLRLFDPFSNCEHVVPFTVFPLRSGNALYGFNKFGPAEACEEDLVAPRLRAGMTVFQLAEAFVDFCRRTGLEEMSLLARGDYLIRMIRAEQGMLGAWQRRMMKENVILEWARERLAA